VSANERNSSHVLCPYCVAGAPLPSAYTVAAGARKRGARDYLEKNGARSR